MNEEKVESPMKAIKRYCLWCSNGQQTEVRECPIKDCPLYYYRFGHTLDSVYYQREKARQKRARQNSPKVWSEKGCGGEGKKECVGGKAGEMTV